MTSGDGKLSVSEITVAMRRCGYIVSESEIEALVRRCLFADECSVEDDPTLDIAGFTILLREYERGKRVWSDDE